MLFKFFEKSVPCYPSNEPALPPRGFLAFVWACARGVRGYVVAMAGLSALIAVYEALLFAVLGRVVDWIAAATPATLWAQRGQASSSAKRPWGKGAALSGERASFMRPF